MAKFGRIKKVLKSLVLMSALVTVLITVQPRSAEAACCCWCPAPYQRCVECIATSTATVFQQWGQTIPIINTFTTTEFTAHRMWIIAILWEDNLLPALMLMADQLSAVAMQQTAMIGMFIDAKHQMETQRVLQKIRAKAHKDYHPSAGMCEFGTSIKSLAASERKTELNAHIMSQRSQDRHLGNANTAASLGPDSDFENRIQQYREDFCDPRDNGGGLDLLCDHDRDYTGGASGATDPERMNKDIDYARTVEYPWTLNIDFTDTSLTDEEEEVLALASNLYGHDVFHRPPGSTIRSVAGRGITATQANYMDARALLAKRSVAENSFNAITSMKSAGTDSSRDFLEAILEELGVDDSNPQPSDMRRLLGMDDNNDEIGPSYYAQMEILTKKIYQNPDFYTNLYDKPANVERKAVAMQAIGLMQKFDLFKSYLRNEANISVLLELAIEDLQTEIENEIASQPN